MADHRDIVGGVLNMLTQRGVDLTGACGAFQITKRVAWLLRAEGAGLMSKPQGNNCEECSVDHVMYPDGSNFDILGDAGGINAPQWNADISVDPARFRPATDPGDDVSPPPPPPPPPPPVDLTPPWARALLDDCREILVNLVDISTALSSLAENQPNVPPAQVGALTTSINNLAAKAEQLLERGIKVHV